VIGKSNRQIGRNQKSHKTKAEKIVARPKTSERTKGTTIKFAPSGKRIIMLWSLSKLCKSFHVTILISRNAVSNHHQAAADSVIR